MSDATRSLDRSLVQGIAWTGGIKWLTQLLSWAVTLVVARLLTPTDYGLLAMAMVYVRFAQIITEGVDAAIIQLHQLNEDQIARLGGLSILLGVALCAGTLGLAAPIARFYGEEPVRWIVIVLSSMFLIRSFQVVPRSLFARDLEFRKLAWIDGFETVTLLLGTLVLALHGLGYWALVLGTVASGVATSALCLAWCPNRLKIPRDLAGIVDAIRFTWHIVGARIAWYVYNNADFAIVGRVLGKDALGAYTFGWNIASIPVERVTALVGRVTPSYFAAVQDDVAALRRFLRNLTEALALITLPACIGLSLVADEFVLTVLGEHWRPAIAPLRWLAIYAAFRSVVALTPQVLIARGHAKLNMHFSIITAIVLPGVFYLGTRWGTTGVAFGWIVGYSALAIVFFVRYALKTIRMRWGEYLRALGPAMSTTLPMTAVVLGARAVLPQDWHSHLRLAVEVLAGTASYVGVMLVAHGDRVRAIGRLLREIRSDRRGQPLPVRSTAGDGGRDRPLLASES